MSRSRRKTPIISNTLRGLRESEKDDKSIANREFRRTNRMLINDALINDSLEEMILHDRLQEVSNIWDFIKDGKHYLDKNSKYYDDKYMRK